MIAKSLRCQGWAPCIIATIWLPEPLLEESLAGVEDELRERCARHPRFARLAVFSLRSAVTRRLLLSGKLVPRRITRFESRVHIVPGWNFGEAQELIGQRLGPVVVEPGTIVLFHVIPAEAFTPGAFTEAWRVPAQEKNNVHVPGHSMGYTRYNADGFLCHSMVHNSQNSPQVDAYTQVFRSGIVEYCFSHSFNPPWSSSATKPMIRGIALEREMVSCFEDAYSRLLRDGENNSIYVGFSLIGIQGKLMFTTELGWNSDEREIRQNSFISPEIYADISGLKEERPFERILLPLIDTLWQVGGYEESPFRIDGKWAPFGNYR
jgi:hypothetical protein